MTYHCPEHPTHTSANPDYCPECGDAMVDDVGKTGNEPAQVIVPHIVTAAPAVHAAPPSGEVLKCVHCGEEVQEGDDCCIGCGRNPFDKNDTGGVPAAAPVVAPPAPVVVAPVRPPAPVAPPAPIATYPVTLRLVARFDDGPRERVANSEQPTDKSDRSVDLDRDVVKIGRTDRKHNILPEISLDGDSGVSRRHAELNRGPDGTYFLKDTDSANGTKLNGTAVEANDPTPVKGRRHDRDRLLVYGLCRGGLKT